MTRRKRFFRTCVCLVAPIIALATACVVPASSAGLRGPSEGGPTHKGDTSPRRFAQPQPTPAGTVKQAPARATAEPTVTLSPVPQPQETYATPQMPAPPKKSASELDRIAYQLKVDMWNAAGVVDPKTTKAQCSVSENDIIRVDTYDFTCGVTLWGTSTKFAVKAKVSRSEVKASWSVKNLPVAEDKALYEATRQAFKPSRVTCDIIGMELVEVGNRNGFTCWVTDVYNESTTYKGELLPNGALAIRPEDS